MSKIMEILVTKIKCYLYEIQSTLHRHLGVPERHYKYHYYFKPGIGLIAVMREDEPSKKVWEKKLISYSLVE